MICHVRRLVSKSALVLILIREEAREARVKRIKEEIYTNYFTFYINNSHHINILSSQTVREVELVLVVRLNKSVYASAQLNKSVLVIRCFYW